MSNLPANLKYTKSHEWVRAEADGSVTIGITDHAQEALGDLVFVELPPVGKSLSAGEEAAVVESVKAAADVYAPISGVVIAQNSAVVDAPESLNSDAWSAWLFKLQPSDPAAIAALLDAAAYQQAIDAE
ncbi:glycine cleavage system protein GcvH [Rhodocyclus tenuis]|uniref:Glycine cleavage system H protein n=2 Tax=Rhodocyclus TaxID=1064 RepID=A0A6L5JUP1_RHOTE|nr:glycine cleavage system protein GcvH [Rhodocyclus gracilis]MQY51093.1 glycine cleavage system protein GcvH [Rhodocyclus gracilis]MRD72023.1 glycine cleavage system protein GcvH [Rhodocyclus gracilis]NJA88803.1 glycine cleavage system protein GcvH [Rhodocyclus gracilis]